MKCYICNCDIVGELKALVVHYKIIHLLKPDSSYTCLENTCSQSFNCLSSFKRHVNKKHAVVISKTSPSLQSGNCVQETSNMAPSIEYSTTDIVLIIMMQLKIHLTLENLQKNCMNRL